MKSIVRKIAVALVCDVLLWECTNHTYINKHICLLVCLCEYVFFFTLVIDWMLTNRSHLLRRPSNRNEFIEAITIKRRILLSVYKFITGAFTLTQIVYLPCVNVCHWHIALFMYIWQQQQQATFLVYNLTKLDQNY